MTTEPRAAIVLAAGLGRRLGPIGQRTPKPLVRVGDKALIDHVLDELAVAGISAAVVNVHHLAAQLQAHLAARDPHQLPRVTISDETDGLLDTGGGVAQALSLFESATFVLAASDVVRRGAGLERLIDAWDDQVMDVLMLLQPRESATGFDGAGDFFQDDEARLVRRGEEAQAPYVYAGLLICHRRVYDNVPAGPFSNNLVWDRAIAAGRLFGVVHGGDWFHVGTPAAIALAERALED
ncbi:MAG: nucleotidyltransferase family protein [Proteobacteria bacterium]|nr:nucleotidyltransferase family protein [Pseudomonadota bacterium]MDA1058757.1 nucleotidyltransferase family protein [Pseudomonadota bacterium]